MRVDLGLFSGGLVMIILLLTGCAKTVEEPVEKLVEADKLVARVASIHKEEGYALIQRYGRVDMGDDSILYTLSVDGQTSNLKATGEKLGQFIAVDILSGELNIGDGVYLRNLTEKAVPDIKESFISDES